MPPRCYESDELVWGGFCSGVRARFYGSLPSQLQNEDYRKIRGDSERIRIRRSFFPLSPVLASRTAQADTLRGDRGKEGEEEEEETDFSLVHTQRSNGDNVFHFHILHFGNWIISEASYIADSIDIRNYYYLYTILVREYIDIFSFHTSPILFITRPISVSHFLLEDRETVHQSGHNGAQRQLRHQQHLRPLRPRHHQQGHRRRRNPGETSDFF